MDIMLREFGRYVDDRQRTALFDQAIARTVRPGDVVVDLGAGFGLLGMLCVRHGARRVYAIEQGPYVELGRAIARDNGMADRIVWVQGNSAEVVLPERADVIVSETLGQWGLEEYTVEYLYDARVRFGKPGVRIIPQDLQLAIAPVSAPRLRGDWARVYGPAWRNVHGFDLTRLRDAVFANAVMPYVRADVDDVQFLAPPAMVAHFQLGASSSSRFSAQVRTTCERAGECDGWLGLFAATLAPGVVLSTWPGHGTTHWGNVLFPVPAPHPVLTGTALESRVGFLGGRGWMFVTS